MKFSAKYLIIIVAFFFISQQGFWNSLSEMGDFSTKSDQLTESIKVTLCSIKEDLVRYRIDLPHTQIKVDWSERN